MGFSIASPKYRYDYKKNDMVAQISDIHNNTILVTTKAIDMITIHLRRTLLLAPKAQRVRSASTQKKYYR